MKKIIAMLALCSTIMFAAVNLNSATKEELMTIKGIGEKKALQIIDFRKNNKIKSPDDLAELKGFGKVLISNIKNDVKVSQKVTEKEKVSKWKILRVSIF